MSNSPIIAVLTGDLVASQQAGTLKVEVAMTRLKRTAEDISEIVGHDTRFTRFRGDGWQIVLASPGWLLRVCLILLADLRAANIGIETRISVGIGIANSLGTENLSDASGSAFLISGHHLDDMPKGRRLFIAGGHTGQQLSYAAIFDLIDHLASQWTQAQAEAVAMALRSDYRTHQEMANQLGITRQAMQSRLSSAGFAALANALATFEHFAWEAP